VHSVDNAHFERYFELICFCANFVQRQATQSRSSFSSVVSHGLASSPKLHRLVHVKMRDSTGTNHIVAKVMKNVGHSKLKSEDLAFLPFLQSFKAEKIRVDNFLVFLDSSRELVAEHYVEEGSEDFSPFPFLFWIPTPDITDFQESHAIVGPKISIMWKDTDHELSLTAAGSKQQILSTESQTLKFQFLQFAYQLLEAKFYKTNQLEVQVLIILLPY
jgi:hypothetical protein